MSHLPLVVKVVLQGAYERLFRFGQLRNPRFLTAKTPPHRPSSPSFSHYLAVLEASIVAILNLAPADP